VPAPPWRLPGTLPSEQACRLTRAGAALEAAGAGPTIVRWEPDALRGFVLHDVLLHELGHHVIQQYTGKRSARVRRTRDHEALAERHARRWRAQLGIGWEDACSAP